MPGLSSGKPTTYRLGHPTWHSSFEPVSSTVNVVSWYHLPIEQDPPGESVNKSEAKAVKQTPPLLQQYTFVSHDGLALFVPSTKGSVLRTATWQWAWQKSTVRAPR